MRARLGSVGLVLLAGAWGFLDGFFVAPRPAFFWPVLIAGIICLALSCPRARRAGTRAGGFGSGLALAAMIASLHLAAQLVLPVILAHLHRIPGAAEPVAGLMRLLGVAAGVDAEGGLVVQTAAGATSLVLTWELAGLPMILRLVVASWAARGFALLPGNVLAIAGAACLRALTLVAVIAGGARVSLAYEPAITLLSFLPLILLMPTRNISVPASPPRLRPQRPRALVGHAGVTAAILLAIAGLCGGVWLGHGNAGMLKKGRILIDESRSNWEWTSPPFDHARYGQKSLYSYSLWRAWIELHYETRVIERPLQDEDLAQADVLVIKTPTSPYDGEIIDRIERFVRGGGGLYLIGDHTNLFGMSTVLNAIAAPYDLAFEFDDTFPLDHEGYDIFRPQWLAPHPALRGIEAYPFETSCTLRVPWSADHMIVGRRLGAEMVDYGHVNFFGNIKLEASERFGLFVQAALLKHGEGRVAAFADSTNFSSFSMLWPGRRQLTLNILDWLNREESGSGARLMAGLLAAGGLGAALAGAWLLGGAGAAARAAACWAALLAFMLSAHVSSAATARRLGTTPPRAAFRTAAFDTTLGEFHMEEASPILSGGPEQSWQAFNTFFINAARSNIWPERTGDLGAALAGHDIVVLVNPWRRPSRGQLEALGSFLDRGGRLLVIDSVLNTHSTAGELLGAFGIAPQRAFLPLDDGEAGAVVPALAVPDAKGIRRRQTRGGGAVVWRSAGRGRIVLFSDGALFSDRGFGGVYTTPTHEQEEVYRGQEEVLRILLETQEEEQESDDRD